MISIMAIWLAALVAPGAQITWLSVSPVSDRTEVVIRVQGDAAYKEPFMMEDGRLVVDISGVSGTAELAQDINRGGIARVRIAQFQPTIARVVVELTQRLDYKVVREEGVIRIQFPNNGGLFEAWSAAVKRASEPLAAPGAPTPASSEPAVRTPVKPAAKAVQTPPRTQEPLMTFTIRDRPLSEVLGDFSAISGKTILAAGKVGATVITAQILPPGLPWSTALESILEANGLSQRTLESGTIIIEDASAVTERAKTQTVQTRLIPLSYVDADSVANAVRSALTPDLGKVSVITASNSLLITDAQPAIDRVLAMIPLVDIQAAKVEISAKIAFIDRTTLEALGVVYDLKDSRGNQLRGLADNAVDANGNGSIEPDESTPDNVVLLGGNSVAALGNANTRVAGPALTLATSLVLGRHTLISFLEALQTVSLSDIQASPMVTTQDNYTASIQVGERTPIRVVDAGSAGGANAPRSQVQVQNTGIIMTVTPHVTGDNVQMKLHTERSNIGAAPAGLDFTFQTQQADNVVSVRDGETVVVGGLTIIEKTKSRSGIPFLMDLPLIGKLFRNDREVENKRDLLILVTPHIVRDR